MRYLKFIVLAIVLFSCGNKTNEKATNEILALLDSAVEEKKDTFQLGRLNLNANWDSLLIVPPYTVLRKVKYSKKIDVEVLKETEIEFRDDICVIAFLREDKIVCYAEINRKYDFSYLSSTKLYSKSNIFRIVADPLTKSRHVIKEK